MDTGHDYTWFVLTQKIIEREFALSGSEQNPDLTGKSITRLLDRAKSGRPGPVAAFMRHGVDFLVAENLPALVAAMNKLTGTDLIDLRSLTQCSSSATARSPIRSPRTPSSPPSGARAATLATG